MADLLKSGAAWLAAARRNYMASEVTYARGVFSKVVLATRGKTDVQVVDGDGNVRQMETADFIINTSDLVLGGQAVLPALGDRITVQLGAVAEVFEVLGVPGMGHYRFCDQQKYSIRVHTKKVI
jgi:hypothetical protein